jgi:hypothetical protein
MPLISTNLQFLSSRLNFHNSFANFSSSHLFGQFFSITAVRHHSNQIKALFTHQINQMLEVTFKQFKTSLHHFY